MRRLIKYSMAFICFVTLILLTSHSNNIISANQIRNENEYVKGLVSSNRTIALLVAEDINHKIQEFGGISTQLMASSDITTTIDKDASNYESNYEFYSDRKRVRDCVNSILYLNRHISNIAFIKPNEVVGDLLEVKENESDFINDFYSSDAYKELIQSAGKCMIIKGLFEEDKVYFLRCMGRQLSSTKDTVIVMAVNQTYYMENLHLPLINSKCTVLDSSGNPLFNSEFECSIKNFDNTSASDSVVSSDKGHTTITSYAKCQNGWIVVVEQNI